MARQVSFIPSFVSFMNTAAPAPTETQVFTTARKGAVRVSTPVTIEAMHFDQDTKSIKVFGSDGHLRECRVERLPSIEHGRVLWRQLQAFGAAKEAVCFKAAGGFSPDKWFFTATKAE